MNYLDGILRDTFKQANGPNYWGEITDLQQLLVAIDVLELAEDCGTTDGLPMRVPDAAATLRSRIGGAAVLPSYARSLEAGYLRRGGTAVSG